MYNHSDMPSSSSTSSGLPFRLRAWPRRLAVQIAWAKHRLLHLIRPGSSKLYFRYCLNPDKKQIRLLVLQPGKWDERIKCSLRVVSLADEPAYCTLSYVWGPEEPQEVIHIDGRDMSIRRNLFDALRRLRSHHPSRALVIWIDAICIDQSSVPERNNQVALMGKIYSQCTEVSVWFGELLEILPPHQRIFIDNFCTPRNDHPPACSCKDDQWKASANIVPNMTESEMAVLAVPILVRLASVKRCDDYRLCQLFGTIDEMLAFRILMQQLLSDNSWFTRMWIVQEAVLPPSGSVYLGPVSFSLDVILKAATNWELHATHACCKLQLFKLALVCISLFRQCCLLSNIRQTVSETRSFDIFFLRTSFLLRKATLDVDLIYGMLGLSDMRYEIQPDYNRPVEDVYIQASRNFLTADCIKETFWLFVYSPNKHRYPSLPSWVIDWTYLETGSLLNTNQVWVGCQIIAENYRPNPITAEETGVGVNFVDKAMVLRGRVLDVLSVIGNGFDHDADTVEGHSRFCKVVDLCRHLVRAFHAPEDPYILPAAYSPANYNWATAWLSTMCAGCREKPGDGLEELTPSEIEAVMLDALNDINSPLLLDDKFDPKIDASYEQTVARMETPILYLQTVAMMIQVLTDKKIYLTRGNHIGFGNAHIESGDKIYLPTGLNTPLILRPVVDSVQHHGRRTYKIISACYLQGFMHGPEKELSAPEEELWIV